MAYDLFGLRIERPDLARRFAERLVYHARAQQVGTGRYPLGLLQDEAIEIAAADKFLDCGCPLGVEPQRLQRLTSEYERRFVGFAQLEIDALSEKLQGVPTKSARKALRRKTPPERDRRYGSRPRGHRRTPRSPLPRARLPRVRRRGGCHHRNRP